MSDFKKYDRVLVEGFPGFGATIRFWDKVERLGDDECWPFSGGRSSEGYGTFHFQGATVGAHRFAVMTRLRRELTGDECVCHHCDNPPCCNPRHLFLGSKSDNSKDAVSKGRVAVPSPDNRGERNGHATVDEETVRAIRRDYDALSRHRSGKVRHDAGLPSLVRKYGVPKGTFMGIATRGTWRHVV